MRIAAPAWTRCRLSAERRLVTVAHSYVVAENRRLAHEMAIAGRGRWRVTAIAPSKFHGDLRQLSLEPLAGEACEVRALPMWLDRSPHLMGYRDLRAAIGGDADAVHCWEEPFVFAGAQIARAAPRQARLIYATFQNLSKQYPWPLRAFERRSLRRADGWIAFGRTVSETLHDRQGYDRRPHRVIPPGVDVATFSPDPDGGARIRRQIGWPDDAPVVGYLGRFVPEKGIEDLLAALTGCRMPWRALFVGGGPQRGLIDRFAASFPGRVHIAEGVRHGEVPRWLNAMTILCAPSRTTPTWREQFGRMLIEAMACGVPVLASDSGEMPAVVADAGRVVRESDPQAWSSAIDALLDDAAARAEASRRGIARARAHFAWPVVARAHLEFFEELLDQPEAGTR